MERNELEKKNSCDINEHRSRIANQSSGTMDSGTTANSDNRFSRSYEGIDIQSENNWQDQVTGSMGSQRSGSMTSRSASETDDIRPTSVDEDMSKRNEYGQSQQEMDGIKNDEKMIRGGYGEERSADNPATKPLYDSHKEPGQQYYNKNKKDSSEQSMDDPMSTSKNY